MELHNKPLITIITSTYQAVDHLPRTIRSVREQEYDSFEWIIVDGASTDGTVDLLSENQDIVTAFISEPDDGIYSAWNKALKLAAGEWIIFIGAGDWLYDSKTLLNASEYLKTAYPKFEIVYGDIVLVSENSHNQIEVISRPWAEIKGRWDGLRPMLPVHPEVFHHQSIFSQSDKPFPEVFRIVGDSYVLLKSFKEKEPLHIPVVIDVMPIGGVSANLLSAKKLNNELKTMNRMLGIKTPLLRLVMEKTKIVFKVFIACTFPNKQQFIIADFYRVLIGKKKKWTIK